MIRKYFQLVMVFALCVTITTQSLAEGPGQSDLDSATKKKLRAKSADDLLEVAKLCESAIDAGLSDDSEEYARSLWVSCLYERAFAITRPIFGQPNPHPQWPAIRKLALRELETAKEVDGRVGDVHLLIAQLESLPGGSRDNAFAAANRATELLTEPKKLSMAYVIRGTFQKDLDSSATDFDRAIELDSRNQDAWRAQAALYIQKGEIDKAINSFESLLEINPNDPISNQAIAELFMRQQKFDEAIAQLDNAIEAGNKSPSLLVLKSNILTQTNRLPEAIESMRAAVQAAPNDNRFRLMLSRLLIQNNDIDLAQESLDRILKIATDGGERDEARILRSVVYSVKSRFDDAARDIRTVLNRLQVGDQRRADLLLQLTQYYTLGQRPSKAIEAATELIEQDDKQWQAYRFRGDAFLSQGKHAEALSDYESARQIKPDESGVLNNLAWVLATSPMDDVRDGKRAVEIAAKACEVTEYKEAHILSTLAAAHAEMGDFEEAIKWSSKAVELDADEEQLVNELESYKNQKPWRELQKVEEKPELSEPNARDLILE